MQRALLPFAAFDNFSRKSSSGWGMATSGHGWSTSSPDSFTCNVGDGVGIITSTTKSDTRPRIITLQTDTNTKTQSILFSFNPVKWGSWGDFGPVLLHKGPDQYVALRIQPGLSSISLWRRKSGDSSIVALAPDKGSNKKPKEGESWRHDYKFSKNQWYWCRIEYDDESRVIRYRVWKNSEEEPSTWASRYSFEGNSSRMSWRSGTPGFMSFGTSEFTTHIRSLYFYNTDTPRYTMDKWAPVVTSSGTLPFVDTFDRTERQGFGKGPASPLWYGTVLENPTVEAPQGMGTVDNGSATLSFAKAYSTNGGYWAFVGDTIKDNKATEVFAQFQAASLTDTAVLRIGPRAREGRNDDKITGAGFALAIPLKKTSTISLVRRLTLSASSWDVFGAASGDVVTKENVTLTENTPYSVRVQIKPSGEGYELRAKLWLSAEAEPSTFDLVYTSDATPAVRQGAPFINVSATGAASVDILEFSASLVTTDAVVVTPPSNSFEVTGGISRETTSSSASVEFTYTGDITSTTESFIDYFPVGKPNEKITVSTLDATIERPRNGLFRYTITGLNPETTYQITGRLEQARVTPSSYTFSVHTAYDGIWISEVRIDNLSTSNFTAALILRKDLPAKSLDNTAAFIRYREVGLVSSYPWSSEIAMDKSSYAGNDNYKGYGVPNFSKAITGLTPDKTYECEIRVTDAEGINGVVSTTEEVVTRIVTTFGRKVAMEWIDPSTSLKQTSPIQIVPEVTTARVRIHYRWDIDDEVSFKVDYHEIGIPYTTKYQDDQRKFLRNTINVGAKFWEARLTGLLPGMDYNVTINVEHPVGTVDGISQYKLTFTTRRQSPIQTKTGKHYLFKVYDKDGKFIGALNDAGEPNFGFHENGGVSDMNIKLPRQANEAGSSNAITLGNRVDVWVVDYTSDGIGKNMVVDADFDLGGWTTSSQWNVAPTGGVDDGACLKVSGYSNSSYALSEFLQPTSVGDAPKPYRLTISVTNLLDQFEDRLRAANVNYGTLQTEVEAALRNLFPSSFLTKGSAANTVLTPQIDRIVNSEYGLLRKARETNNYQILDSVELAVATDTLAEMETVKEEIERQGCQVTVNEETEADSVPYVLMLAARALKGQITAQIEYVDVVDPLTGSISTRVSEESVTTFGSSWQILKLLFTPPRGTRLMRIRLTAQGDTVGSVDKVQLMPQELLIYRGRIETIKTSIDGDGETINLEVMGLVAQLTDYYVQFKQWVDKQPAKDQPKLVDLSVVEDESPPITWVADTNLVKFRQANTPENRHAILFPEITSTGVKLRVYYDGDDNNNADCVVYYTPNMNSVMTNRVFTGVEVNQIIYSIEEVSLVSEFAGSVVVGTFPQNSEFKVLSATLKTSSNSVYKWVNVQSTANSGLVGWLPFESMTDLRGSRAGGVSVLALSRSTIPPKTPSTNSGSGAGSGGGSGAGSGSGSGGGNSGSGSFTYGLNYGTWHSVPELKNRKNALVEHRKQLYVDRGILFSNLNKTLKYLDEFKNIDISLLPQSVIESIRSAEETFKTLRRQIKSIDDEIALINKEIGKINDRIYYLEVTIPNIVNTPTSGYTQAGQNSDDYEYTPPPKEPTVQPSGPQ